MLALSAASILKDLELLHEFEQFYDAWGLALSIAVLSNKQIALSSKHWLKNYYIKAPSVESSILWDVIKTTVHSIKRELTASPDEPYVYVTNLSRSQTNKLYDVLIEELDRREIGIEVMEVWECYGWQADATNIIRFEL